MTKAKRHQFSKCVVVLVLIVGLVLTAVCVKAWLYTNSIDGYSLSVLMAFWGGELLLLCLKRVLGDTSKTEPKEIKPKEGESI